METTPVSILFCFVWLSLDENELAVLAQERIIYIMAAWESSEFFLIKVGKIQMLLQLLELTVLFWNIWSL